MLACQASISPTKVNACLSSKSAIFSGISGKLGRLTIDLSLGHSHASGGARSVPRRHRRRDHPAAGPDRPSGKDPLPGRASHRAPCVRFCFRPLSPDDDLAVARCHCGGGPPRLAGQTPPPPAPPPPPP